MACNTGAFLLILTKEQGLGQREVGFSLHAMPLQHMVLNFRELGKDEAWSKEGWDEIRSLS